MTTMTDPVNYSEIARRLTAAGMQPTTRQRIKRIAESDPEFPRPIGQIGRQKIFEWEEVRRFFAIRDITPGPKGWRRGEIPPPGGHDPESRG